MRKVAVIGAGPGGLVAARYLKSEGFNPVVHEQGARVGGQWSADPYHSGVWPAMRTNTSRIMTSFSDLPHYAGCPTYPTNEEMGEYLQRYAETSDLVPHIRLNSPVRELRRDTPMSFRMSGRDSLPDAPQRFAEDVRAFRCMPSNEFAPAQITQLQALVAARNDAAFSHYVDTIRPANASLQTI
jgi:phytoene dehydrogenase-like protein